MNRTVLGTLALVALDMGLPLGLSAQHANGDMKSDGSQEAALIKNALSAAPDFIAEHAAVLDMEGHQVRPGTNGWSCFPDMPQTPGNDPMCVDAQWQEWTSAWMNKTEPHITGVGISHMLQGGWDASNSDPFATQPPAGEDSVVTGPHIMVVVPDPETLEGISTDPKNGGPCVMYKGTPFARIMVPVGR